MKIKYFFLALHLLIFSGMYLNSAAEVIYCSQFGFSVKNEILIAAEKNMVFKFFSEDIGKWWQDAHTYSGNSENMLLDLKAGGSFIELLPNGSVTHMSIVYVDSVKMVRMEGGLGPLQSLGVSGSMTWSFEDTETGTKLVLIYNVSGYTPDGLESWAEPVDAVLRAQLESLKKYSESNSKL